MSSSSLQFVDLNTAREARGVRTVVGAVLPSPGSEAAKGVFSLAGVPALAVPFAHRDPDEQAQTVAWMNARNVPAVLHDDAPPRTGSAEIVSLADRFPEPRVAAAGRAGRGRAASGS